VVLPAPDAPMIETNSPGKTEPCTSLMMVRSFPPGKILPQQPLGASATIFISCHEIETLF